MDDSERLECRYFCDSASSEFVEKTLDSIGALTKISYSLPITETVYFTYGERVKYETPAGLMIRLRRYAPELSDVMEITNDIVLLEVKKDNQASGVNVKERISMSGINAIKLLAETDDRLGLRRQLGIAIDRQLLPTGSTQSYRCHWMHTSGLRITFDRDIIFFLFKEDLYLARAVAILGEGKLEFKFPKTNGRDNVFEQNIVAACGCARRTPGYLERRARECMLKHISKKDNH